MNKKIGILGGTFDPIHLGHLILAEAAYDKFDLDMLLIMPSAKPPHKSNKEITDSCHRCKMVELVCEDNEHFIFSDYEIMRKGKTFTVDTLSLLKKENPENEYYFIIGADSLFNIENWKDPEKILLYSTILVAQRDDFDIEKIENKIKFLKNKYKCKIEIVDIPMIDISSTMIIDKINKNESVKYYVTDKVNDYIVNNHLYKD